METDSALANGPQQDEPYADFVKRTYTERGFYLKQLAAGRRLGEGVTNYGDYCSEAYISVVDFQANADPRTFYLWSKPSPPERHVDPVSLQTHLGALQEFVRKTSSSSQGLVVLWENLGWLRDGFEDGPHIRSAAWAALAEAISADPKTIYLLKYWISEQKNIRMPRDAGYEHGNKYLNKYLDRVFRRNASKQDYDDISERPGCRTLKLTLAGADLFNLSDNCMLHGGIIPIYLICTYNAAYVPLPVDLLNWLVSKSTPESCISAITKCEIQLMEDALNDVLAHIPGKAMDQDIYAASRYLRLAMKTFRQDFDHWQSNTIAPASLSDLEEWASAVTHSMDLFEPDIRDAYQILRDEATLKEARKSIQMAEKSIEMSEKSIKESERVRVLTIIAFIFLPVSLASSIFGMNVKPINNDTTPFYAFLVTAIALFLGALFIWAGCSVLMRLQKMDRALKTDLGWRRRRKSWKALKIVDHDWTDRQKSLLEADSWQLRMRAATTSLWTRRDALDILYDIGRRRMASEQQRKDEREKEQRKREVAEGPRAQQLQAPETV